MPEQERSPNSPPVSGSPTAESESDPASVPSRTSGNEADGLTLTDRLAAAEARASTLEVELESERGILRQAQALAGSVRDERDALKEQLNLAAAKYREAVLSASPEVPPDLVAGDSVEEVDRSLAAARKTVDAVRRQLASRTAAERVPAGAPARSGPDLSALSPREKIALALSRG